MRFIERENIEQTRHRLHVPGWKGREARFAVLADLHARPEDGDYVERIVRQILAMQPDAVLSLGDYLNGHDSEEAMSLEELAEHLRPLTRKPCFSVLGNHDYYHDSERASGMLRKLGMIDVEGKRAGLEIGENAVDIGGIRCLYTFDSPGTVPQPCKGVPLLPPPLASGLASVCGHPCYVVRGLGTSLSPFRLFCRPELLLLTLLADGS